MIRLIPYSHLNTQFSSFSSSIFSKELRVKNAATTAFAYHSIRENSKKNGSKSSKNRRGEATLLRTKNRLHLPDKKERAAFSDLSKIIGTKKKNQINGTLSEEQIKRLTITRTLLGRDIRKGSPLKAEEESAFNAFPELKHITRVFKNRDYERSLILRKFITSILNSNKAVKALTSPPKNSGLSARDREVIKFLNKVIDDAQHGKKTVKLSNLMTQHINFLQKALGWNFSEQEIEKDIETVHNKILKYDSGGKGFTIPDLNKFVKEVKPEVLDYYLFLLGGRIIMNLISSDEYVKSEFNFGSEDVHLQITALRNISTLFKDSLVKDCLLGLWNIQVSLDIEATQKTLPLINRVEIQRIIISSRVDDEEQQGTISSIISLLPDQEMQNQLLAQQALKEKEMFFARYFIQEITDLKLRDKTISLLVDRLALVNNVKTSDLEYFSQIVRTDSIKKKINKLFLASSPKMLR